MDTTTGGFAVNGVLLMKNILFVSAVFALAIGPVGLAGADAPGKSAQAQHPHAAVGTVAENCKPKPGTEGMKHDGKDHPMPQTKGMQGMDPAQHMVDCEPAVKTPPAATPAHDHSKTK